MHFINKEQEAEFEDLYKKYYQYIYKWEVGYEEDFVSDKYPVYKIDFKQDLNEEGMRIKVVEGY